MREKKAEGKRLHLWAAIYGVFLTGYAVFTLLDAFVLPRDMVYLEDVTDEPSSKEMTMDSEDPGQGTEETTVPETSKLKEMEETVITDTSYESAGIDISITSKREYGTEIYIADVAIKDISYLRAGLAGGAFGRNIKDTTSVMAEENMMVVYK